MNFYELLGVDQSATEKEIKRAYRKKSAAAHPDVGGSEEEFKKLLAAYETLVDPEKRAFYDEHGEQVDEAPNMPEEILSEVMNVYLEKRNYDRRNILKDSREHLDAAIKKQEADLKNISGRVGKAKKLLEVFEAANKNTDNPVGLLATVEVLKEHVETTTNELLEAEYVSNSIKEARSLLSSLGYEPWQQSTEVLV